MDPNLRTLSLSAWMSLPGLDFNAWEQSNPVPNADPNPPSKDNHREPVKPVSNFIERRNLSLKKREDNKEIQTRALISRVAEYYESYVREMELERFFWNDVTVTNVMPIRMHGTKRSLKNYRWLVVG